MKRRAYRSPDGEIDVEVRFTGRMAQLMYGGLSVEELDTDELLKGQLKDRNGRFTGKAPQIIPRQLHDACVRELLKRGEDMVRESFADAINTFRSIATDPNADPGARLKAAQYIWERVAGKLPDKVEVRATVAAWQQDIESIVSEEVGLNGGSRGSNGKKALST